MNINEIKKALYKEKPQAYLVASDFTGNLYKAHLLNGKSLSFFVPITERETLDEQEPAQLMIRWLQT